jgi:hypothetical protein
VYRWIGGLVIGIVVFAALVSGCGEDSATSSSLTKAEFVKQANAICAKRKQAWQTGLASYEKEVKAQNAENEIEAQVEIAEGVMKESMLPALQEQLKSLEGLSAPEGSEKQVAKMLQNLSKGLKRVEKAGVKDMASVELTNFEDEAQKLGVTCSN